MFVASFVFLFIMSVGSLAMSIYLSFNRDKSIPRSAPSWIMLAILAIFSAILVYESHFTYKLLALVFMLGSLVTDYVYYKEYDSEGTSIKISTYRHMWWKLIDNSAWVALTLVLFFN